MFKKTLICLALASTVGMTGCNTDGESGQNDNPDYKIDNPDFSGRTYPIFDPLAGDLPLPNDLIFDSEQGDGTFGVDDTKPPVTTALNELSGASTVAPTVIQFNGDIDPSTVITGKTVFLLELDYASGDPVQALSIKEPPTLNSSLPDVRADVVQLDGNSAIRILPIEPLTPRKRYIAIVTNGVKDVSGDPIVQSPFYGSLTDENQPLGSDKLAPVRALINGLWENVAGKFFAATKSGLTADNIAISYSFTTSNDEKVLEYIAEPGTWFADQLKTFVGVSTAKKLSGAAQTVGGADLSKVKDADDNLVWDLNGDGAVTSADFDVDGDGDLDVADFNLDGSTDDKGKPTFGYGDVKLAVQGSLAAFPSAGIKQALNPIFTKALPNGCMGLTNVAAMKCTGYALATTPKAQNGFAELLPDISDGKISFDSAVPVGAVSAIAERVRSAVPDNPLTSGVSEPRGVIAAQGSMKLPYYLGKSKDTVNSVHWEADSGLAVGLNTAFKPLGLTIPQEDPDISKAVNYIFPFPKERSRVVVPVLALYPDDAATNGLNGVVIYQHGITTDRSAALTFGTALAANGYAVLAIDQPLHGVTPFSKEDQEKLALSLLTGAGLPDAQAQQLAPAVVGADQSTLVSAFQAAGKSLQEATGTAISLINTVANAGSTIAGIKNSGNERHFNLYADAQNQVQTMKFDTSNPKGDGESGSLFINLSNFLTARDNARESAVDQMTLRASLDGLELPDGQGSTAYTLNTDATFPATATDSVYFAGHSLGTITGAPYVSAVNQNSLDIAADAPGNPTSNQIPLANKNNDIKAASLLTPGGGVVRLLENSPTFAPIILLGLQQKGLEQGDASLETYFNIFQAAYDTADPINFTDNLAAQTDTKVLLSVINGDKVIPNAADKDVWGIPALDQVFVPNEENELPATISVDSFNAPLAGALPLTSELSGEKLADKKCLVRYDNGTHGTPTSAGNGEGEDSEKAPLVFASMVKNTLGLFKANICPGEGG